MTPMRIVYLAAGAGQMYCGACARDMVLIRGLIERGHDVQVIPLYTPLRIDGDQPFAAEPVFLGGINAYLQQRSSLFRWLPPFADRILDSPTLLKLVSRFAISTKPSQLGAMTVSVLAGRDGRQHKEVERLLGYLGQHAPPDIFVITNSLLSGLALPLKGEYGVPVLCGLQGEESFISSVLEPHRSEAQELMRKNAEDIDRLIAPTRTYADTMKGYLGVEEDKLRVVRTGVSAADYGWEGPRQRDPFTIAYLSVITPKKASTVRS